MYFQNAKDGDNSIVFYIITFLLVIASMFLGNLPIFAIILAKTKSGDLDPEILNEFASNPDFSLIGVEKNAALLLLIIPFIIGLGVLYLAVKYLHKKRFTDLIRPLKKIDWNRIFFSFGFWLIMGVLTEGLFYFMDPANYSFSFSGKNYLILLALAIVVLPFQTTFEEIFTRGYLMQGIYLLFNNRWAAVILTSVLFASLHLANPEIVKFGLGIMVPYYFLAGLFLALITVFDQGLELALGVHWATNFYGSTIVTFAGGALQTDALVTQANVNATLMLIAFLVQATIFIIFCYKKYKWNFNIKLEPINS